MPARRRRTGIASRYRLPGVWFAAKVPARETRYAGVEFWGGQALHRVV
ncbi:hypothetical protein ACH41H_37285 [Streptomyces sp. NPDC020800]